MTGHRGSLAAAEQEQLIVHCPQCQQNNPAEARFCLACGTRLRLTCKDCGTELPPRARYCFECGHPTVAVAALPGAPPAPGAAAAHPAQATAAPAAPAAQTILDRSAVLSALYQQGLQAVDRGDSAAAATALLPVAEEASGAFPDAHTYLEELQRSAEHRALAATPPPQSPSPPLPAEPRPSAAPQAVLAAAPSGFHESGAPGSSLRALTRRLPPADARRWLRWASSQRILLLKRGAISGWTLAALGAVVLAGILLLPRGGGSDPSAATPQSPAAVPTRVPIAELFARCESASAAEDWAEAIRACRVVRARDPDYAGLTDKLTAAYIGRGQQRLAAGSDLTGAADDFKQALSYNAESTDAQTALRRLQAYQAGEKALTEGRWDDAVAALSPVQTEDSKYLEARAERSAEGLLFIAWLRWGQSALNAGDRPDAAVRCAQALTIVADDPEAQSCVQTASSPDAEAAWHPGQWAVEARPA